MVQENVIKSVLTLYGLETTFSEQKEYINYHREYGYIIKIILSVLLENGKRVVIKILHEDLLARREQIEKESVFSEILRKHGIPTPMRYMANGRYCNEYVYNNLPCNVTVEDWCGEELAEITTEISYKIGELMAHMHTISFDNKCELGRGTLFSAAYKNDVDAYEEFCSICENKHLNQSVVAKIKELRQEKLSAIRAVWDGLPKAAVQGDMSINNLTNDSKHLIVFDYNCSGDEVLVSDFVMEGFLIAYEMELPNGTDPSYRKQIFSAFLKGYLSIRKLSAKEADTAWDIYTLYHGLWFSRILYNENSLEKLVQNEDYTSANDLLTQILEDMTECDDGRFRK